MTTNQTIDGVPRTLLENCANYTEGSASFEVLLWHKKLRALLDWPAVQYREVDGVHCPNPECCAWIAPNSQCCQCKPAAQPQGEPVAPFYIGIEDFNQLVRDDISVSYVRVSREKRGPFTLPLYAEQPAPVAITLNQVLAAYDYADSHPHKYLRGTTNWCAAVAHKLNACLDEVTRLNGPRTPFEILHDAEPGDEAAFLKWREDRQNTK